MEIRSSWSIADAIVESGRKAPDRPALTIDGETWRYHELLAAAHQLATRLPQRSTTEPQPVVAIMAHRHCSSYVGILAALLSGHAYVPINVQHPDKRNFDVLQRSGAQRIICGEMAAERIAAILAEDPGLKEKLQIIHCSDGKSAIPATDAPVDLVRKPMTDTAYILFTSGSTGEPEGVPISHGNLTGYLEAVASIMDIRPEDRFSQTFELTFDLSVHDLLVCWTNGAHLIVPSSSELAVPADYIREYGISCWFSVPSLAYQIQRQGHLRSNAFPGLRWSLFCGEALPSLLARQWVAAAPASRVENWYGPTEATIACSRFALSALNDDQSVVQNDLVPIGIPFPGMEMTICGEDLCRVADGVPGELLLSGRQVARGYLADSEKNKRRFVTLPGKNAMLFRTGDRAVRAGDGNVQFLGRVDNQVKIRGFRVELGAIEAEIRGAGSGCNVIAFSWPPGDASGTSVVAAIEGRDIDVETIIEAVRLRLPEYMVPSRIVCLPKFPTNASGKADRKAIAQEVKSLIWSGAGQADLSPLSPLAARLMQAILSISPQLSPTRITQVTTLFASGMDSLSFISLTARLELDFGLTLKQEDVVALAEMSFSEMVDAVTRNDCR